MEDYVETGQYADELATSFQIHDEAKPAKKGSQRTTNYSTKEDVLIVSSWLNLGMHSIIGNKKKSGSIWKKINSYFKKNQTVEYNRSQDSFMNRWSIINRDVNKFVGLYAQIQ